MSAHIPSQSFSLFSPSIILANTHNKQAKSNHIACLSRLMKSHTPLTGIRPSVFKDFVGNMKEWQKEKLTIQVLKKDSDLRTKEEKIFLKERLEFLFGNEIAFNEHDVEILNFFKYDHFEKNRIILKHGDYAKKVYFILSGEVHSFIPRILDFNEDDNPQELPTSIQKNDFPSLRNFTLQNILRKGDIFGDSALLLKGISNFTTLSTIESEFATLPLEHFYKVKKKSIDNNLIEELNFLSKTSLFCDWRFVNISLLIQYFEQLSFPKGHIIYREKSINNGIYIVYEGCIELFKYLSSHNEDNKVLGPEKNGKEATLNNYENEKSNKFYNTPIVLAKLEKGQIFGDEELFREGGRVFSARVISHDCSLYFLKKEILFENAKGKRYLDRLRNEANSKTELRVIHFNKIKNLGRKEKMKVQVENRKKTASFFINERTDQLYNLSKFSERQKTPALITSSIRKEVDEKSKSLKTVKDQEAKQNDLDREGRIFRLSLVHHILNNVPKYKGKAISNKEIKDVHNSINNEIRLKVESVMNKKISGTPNEKPKLIKRRQASYSDRSSLFKVMKVERNFIEKMIGKKQNNEENNYQIEKPQEEKKVKEKVMVTTNNQQKFIEDYNFIIRKQVIQNN